MRPEIRFTTTAQPRPRGGISIVLPVAAAATWGARARHDVTGTIGGYPVRGNLVQVDGQDVLELGPSWCRDPRVGPGTTVEVVLAPEPPQLETVDPDLRAALLAVPAARRQFESLATFYRKGFVRWIEEAKRPETRTARIERTIAALAGGRREP
jgi:hypothetical protein